MEEMFVSSAKCIKLTKYWTSVERQHSSSDTRNGKNDISRSGEMDSGKDSMEVLCMLQYISHTGHVS